MKDKLHIRFLWLLVPFLAASCLYLFLYQYNNKYTRTTIQPANGLLILSEKELQTDPVRFLKSGWSFYPDQLLSPEDFSDGIRHLCALAFSACGTKLYAGIAGDLQCLQAICG